jgi:hypothetical protein
MTAPDSHRFVPHSAIRESSRPGSMRQIRHCDVFVPTGGGTSLEERIRLWSRQIARNGNSRPRIAWSILRFDPDTVGCPGEPILGGKGVMSTAETDTGAQAGGALRLLRANGPLHALFTARIVSYAGDSLSIVALMLHVANTTGSAGLRATGPSRGGCSTGWGPLHVIRHYDVIGPEGCTSPGEQISS